MREKKSSRIRTFPMAASPNFFSPSPGAAQNILHLNITQHATGKRILKQPPIPSGHAVIKKPRNRPVIRAAGAPRLLPEKIFSVPLRQEAAPPALPLFPVNFIPPLLPEKNFSRLFTGTAAARRERYSEPFRLKIAGADSPAHNRPPSVWRQYLPGKSASADNRSRPSLFSLAKVKSINRSPRHFLSRRRHPSTP